MSENMQQKQLYHLGVKAIIHNNNGQILLLKHVKGYWDLPGGGMQQGEDARTTLLREVCEETGLTALSDIKPDSMVLTNVRIAPNIGLILWCHNCRLKIDQPIILSDEHTEYVWVDPSEAKAMTSIRDIGAPHIFK